MLTEEQLDAIPHEQRDGFPDGVSEIEYAEMAEMDAFLTGLHYADDTDVVSGTPFFRDGRRVVRIVVGDWNEREDV